MVELQFERWCSLAQCESMRSPPPCRTGLLWASAEQTSIIPLRLSKCSCSSFHSRIMIMNLLLNNQQNNKQTMKTVLSTGWPLVVMSQRWWTANSTGKRDWEVQADNRTQFQISNIEIRSLPTYLAPIFSIRLICIKWADKSVCVCSLELFSLKSVFQLIQGVAKHFQFEPIKN